MQSLVLRQLARPALHHGAHPSVAPLIAVGAAAVVTIGWVRHSIDTAPSSRPYAISVANYHNTSGALARHSTRSYLILERRPSDDDDEHDRH